MSFKLANSIGIDMFIQMVSFEFRCTWFLSRLLADMGDAHQSKGSSTNPAERSTQRDY